MKTCQNTCQNTCKFDPMQMSERMSNVHARTYVRPHVRLEGRTHSGKDVRTHSRTIPAFMLDVNKLVCSHTRQAGNVCQNQSSVVPCLRLPFKLPLRVGITGSGGFTVFPPTPAAGNCENGDSCTYCHQPHYEKTVKLDKKQRSFMQSLSHIDFFSLIFHFCREKVEFLNITEEADEVLKILQEEAGKTQWTETISVEYCTF